MAERRLRVCQFTPSLWNGGAEERMARILGGFDRRRFELAWLGFGGAREALVARAGADVQIEPIARDSGRGIELSRIPRIARTLRRLSPDVLHIHNWSTSAYGIAAARLAGVPTVLYEAAGRESPDGPPERRQRMMRSMAPQIRCFTTVCAFLGAELERYWGAPHDAVRVMPTGVDLERLATARQQRLAARARLGVPADACVVGSLSVLRPVKRVEDLIAAVGRLASARPTLHLVVAGDPLQVSVAELEAWGRAAGIAGRLHIPGLVDDPADVISAYDVFVSCSIFEGASNAIIEAMATSLPVVGTRVGGTPELIEHDTTGLLVEPLDVTALSAAIERLVDDRALRERMGAAARRRAEAAHGEAHMIAAYESLYAELAAEPRGLRERVGAYARSTRALIS